MSMFPSGGGGAPGGSFAGSGGHSAPHSTGWSDPDSQDRRGLHSSSQHTMEGSVGHHISSAGGNDKSDGRLIIKIRLGDDVRRIPLNNEDLTYVRRFFSIGFTGDSGVNN